MRKHLPKIQLLAKLKGVFLISDKWRKVWASVSGVTLGLMALGSLGTQAGKAIMSKPISSTLP